MATFLIHFPLFYSVGFNYDFLANEGLEPRISGVIEDKKHL